MKVEKKFKNKGNDIVSKNLEAVAKALEGLTSKELRESLHEDISQHTVLDYRQIRGDQAKVDVRADGKIWDMYSGYNFNLSDYCYDVDVTEGECYNREHMLPKSCLLYTSPSPRDCS